MTRREQLQLAQMADSAAHEIYGGKRRFQDLIPIRGEDNSLVGFRTPEGKTVGGTPRIGTIYVRPEYRRQGHAYRETKSFYDSHPEMAWFARDDNKASLGLAKKLGLIPAGRARGSKKTMMFEKPAADIGKFLNVARRFGSKAMMELPEFQGYQRLRHLMGNSELPMLGLNRSMERFMTTPPRPYDPSWTNPIQKSVGRQMERRFGIPGLRSDMARERMFGGGLPGQQWSANLQKGAAYHPVTGFPYRPTPAMGIPDRQDMGDFSKLKEGDLLDYFIQRHLARRSGPHYDLRAGTPKTNLYSWATKKELPQPGGKPIAVFQQPVHAHSYGSFEGELYGYGAGTVKQHKKGQLLITRMSPEAIHFTTADQAQKRYVLLKPKTPGDKRWLLVAAKPLQKTGLSKAHYKVLKPHQVDKVLSDLQENAVVQPKIDGALAYVQLGNDRAELFSHRTSKRTGGPIVHTERVLGKNPKLDIPKKYRGSLLLGETYGERDGKAIPSQELGGILNAGLGKSLQKQKDQKVNLKTLLFGLGQLKGKDVQFKMPYSEQQQHLKEILPHLPEGKFALPEEATTPEEAKALLSAIEGGKHPLTHEGIVVHPEEGVPSKYKIRPEHDVRIRNIFPGEGRLAGTHAGGFEYSHEPEGPIVGRVGTGISDELRRELWEHPEDYIGRVARVTAHDKFPGGALRVPSLISLHEDR